MLFTLNVKQELNKYRLTKDGSWRLLDNFHIIEKDRTYEEYEYCYNDLDSLRNNKIIELKGTKYKFEDMANIAESFKIPRLYPLVHRTEKPHIFTIENIEKVISSGDDAINNILTIDLEGYLRLYNQDIIKDSINYRIPVAVRNETFIAGNNYVGFEAAKDKSFIQDTRLTLLSGLYNHLSTGELDFFVDLLPSESESELLNKINNLYK